MPGWSPEIANEFIRLAMEQDKQLDQMKLQKLVYIAHGFCLAFKDTALTGDRPEAWAFGPEYRRLADALVSYGIDPVTREITIGEAYPDLRITNRDAPARAELEDFELDTIKMVFEDFGHIESAKLSHLTTNDGAPWSDVYADGSGLYREIGHKAIKEQFSAYGDDDNDEEEGNKEAGD